MVITFMIGNGFDLACGLKSSYKDVYEGYVKTQSKSELIAKFKKDLDENWENWADFEMGMAEYAQNFDNEAELIECVTDFREYMEDHLKREEEKFHKTFGNVYPVYGENINDYVESEILHYYKGCGKGLDVLGERAMLEAATWNFINFNYTDILETILNECFYGFHVENIHGTLAEDDVVMGADNLEQVKTKFPKGTDVELFFIKPYINEENDPRRVETCKRYIQSSDCIIVFGLSMGDSDLSWKNEIKEWLLSNEEHHLFIYDFEYASKQIRGFSMRKKTERDIIQGKCLLLGLESEGSYIKQIHIPVGYKMLAIQEKIDEWIANDLNSVA